jgi:oxygen-independent coproporphyrinogen-3 oxidase
MGGVYIHIPFCRQACRYCDFYFTVSHLREDAFVEALKAEMLQRSPMYRNMEMGSLYLGGGTPSRLSPDHLQDILAAAREQFSFVPGAELSVECNPEDLDRGMLEHLLELGVNRLSIGIQSFSDEQLELLRRVHDARQAETSVLEARRAGFRNLSIDLIFGIPGQTVESWTESLDRALSLPVNHLSAYHLSYEEGTVFAHWRKKGKLKPVSDETSVAMYGILRERMQSMEFEHYEISNFAKSGMRSRHNQLYWSGEPYLGLGPSAHSFDGETRAWNVASLTKYLQGLSSGTFPMEKENLNLKEQYHDYLITSLRTCEGVNPSSVHVRFGDRTGAHFHAKASVFLKSGDMLKTGERLIIHPGSWIKADYILRELFLD